MDSLLVHWNGFLQNNMIQTIWTHTQSHEFHPSGQLNFKPHGSCSSWMYSVIIWAVLSDEQIEQPGEGGASTKFCLQNFVNSSFNENTHTQTHTWKKMSTSSSWVKAASQQTWDFFPTCKPISRGLFSFFGAWFFPADHGGISRPYGRRKTSLPLVRAQAKRREEEERFKRWHRDIGWGGPMLHREIMMNLKVGN